jgi:hypothetical protein
MLECEGHFEPRQRGLSIPSCDRHQAHLKVLIASGLFIDTVSRLAIAMILPSGHSV